MFRRIESHFVESKVEEVVEQWRVQSDVISEERSSNLIGELACGHWLNPFQSSEIDIRAIDSEE